MSWSSFSLLNRSQTCFGGTASSVHIEEPRKDEGDGWNSRNIWKVKEGDVPFISIQELLSSYKNYQHRRELFPTWKN